MKRLIFMLLLAVMSSLVLPSSAQSLFHRADSILVARYYRLGNIDTAYISRPQTKWTITARMNVSGAKIEAGGHHHRSRSRRPPMGQQVHRLIDGVQLHQHRR